MVKIIKMNVTGSFKYLWLKYITGVNLKVHCARSLIGTYSKYVSSEVKKIEEPVLLDEAEAKVYYLCGVTTPYKWIDNFHLAFKEQEGSKLYVNRKGIEIEIDNAVEIPITDKFIDKADPNANKKAYYTCRNWQFAYMLYKNEI